MFADGPFEPTDASEATLKLLRSRSDPDKAASYQRYFKEEVPLYGFDTKSLQQIIKDLIRKVSDEWTIQDSVEFCDLMIRDPHLESRGIGYQVVAHFVQDAEPELLPAIETWLEHSCPNWALVDNLALSVLSPLIRKFPDLIPEILEWTQSQSLWVRRGAAVAFVPLARDSEYLDPAYTLASHLFSDREDLVQKALGWLLREAGKSDMERLGKFLIEHGPKIPRTTVRYAIERFPAEERKRLLGATR